MLRSDLSRHRIADRGFTLIETLVAFAILAVSLAVLTGAFSSGMRGIDKSERYTTATLLARSTLEQVGISIAVVPGEAARETGNGFLLRLRIVRTSGAPSVTLPNGLIVPYEVAATVEWSGGAMTLTTLRLAVESDPYAETRGSGTVNTDERFSP